MSDDEACWENGRPVQPGPFKFESSEVIQLAPKPPFLTTKARGKNQSRWERVMPIDPATEWSERPVTTAVEIPRHTHAAVSVGRGQRRQTWILSGHGPAGSEPGPAKWLALAVAVFRLWMRTSWEQAIRARRG